MKIRSAPLGSHYLWIASGRSDLDNACVLAFVVFLIFDTLKRAWPKQVLCRVSS